MLVEVVLHRGAHLAPAKLRRPLGRRADQRLHPARHVVEEVVLREREARVDAHADHLAVHRVALAVHVLEPLELRLPDARVAVEVHHRAPVERPPARRHELVGERIAHPVEALGRDRPADVPDAELAQHLGERQELLARGDLRGQEASVLGTVDQVAVG